MYFSPAVYIGIVVFVIVVNIWMLVRFLKKAAGWDKPQETKRDV